MIGKKIFKNEFSDSALLLTLPIWQQGGPRWIKKLTSFSLKTITLKVVRQMRGFRMIYNAHNNRHPFKIKLDQSKNLFCYLIWQQGDQGESKLIIFDLKTATLKAVRQNMTLEWPIYHHNCPGNFKNFDPVRELMRRSSKTPPFFIEKLNWCTTSQIGRV